MDLEGLPHVVVPAHLSLKGSLYKEARKIATQVTYLTAETLHDNGFDEIIIADSHGPMVNIEIDNLPKYCQIVRGNPRPISMVAGIENCDAALFLGYHAKFGTARSTFDHTYSGGTIHQVLVNGVPVSEFLLNAYTAGEYDIPVILVAGDERLLIDDVEPFAPWAERVSFKHSFSRLSAISPSMQLIKEKLQQGTRNAIKNFHNHEVKALVVDKPIKMTITFQSSHLADIAEFLPNSIRLDGLTIEYMAESMVEAYKTFQLLVSAAQGAKAMLEYLK